MNPAVASVWEKYLPDLAVISPRAITPILYRFGREVGVGIERLLGLCLDSYVLSSLPADEQKAFWSCTASFMSKSEEATLTALAKGYPLKEVEAVIDSPLNRWNKTQKKQIFATYKILSDVMEDPHDEERRYFAQASLVQLGRRSAKSSF